MRKIMIETAALTAVLLVASLALGQPGPGAGPPGMTPSPPPGMAPGMPTPPGAKDAPAKSKLEEMLEKALHDNPDLRLAAAKVAEADAELNRARLLVVQKVATLYQAIEAQKAAVDGAGAELDEMMHLAAAAATGRGEVRTAEQKLIDAKAKLASLEAEMPYLLGKSPRSDRDALNSLNERNFDIDLAFGPGGKLVVQGAGPWFQSTAGPLAFGPGGKLTVQGPTADRIRAALDKPFEFECKDKPMPLRTVLKEMNNTFQSAAAGGLVIKDNLPEGDKTVISADFYGMPLGAALELIEDATGNRVVVRDYGLFVAPKDSLPPGAPLLDDFWKKARGDAKEPPKPHDK